MTVSAPDRPRRQVTPRRRIKLGAGQRKAVLLVHILSAGSWIGVDVTMAVLVFTARVTDDPATAALCYRALRLFAVWPMVGSGIVCLASGILLGLGTKYGLLRYWWVAVKLVINVALCTLILLALRPSVLDVAAYGTATADQNTATAAGSLIFPAIVSPTALLIAMVLSVFKPWGRIRSG